MRAISRLFSVLALLLFVSIAGMAAIGAAYNPNILVESSFKGQHVAVGGLPIRVIEQGTGPDVLLIHGSPGSLEDWTPLMSRLEGSFRVHAYDRPGYGYSGDSGKYSVADNAKTALGLIETLGLKQVTVVGHSYGGATALAMALTAPERVASYVIIDSSAYELLRAPDEMSSLLAIPMLGIGFATVLGPVLAPSRIREGIRKQFRSEPPAGFIDARVRMWTSPKVLHAQAIESLGAGDDLAAQSPRYPQIRAKVHILGQADDAARRKTAERLHADVRGSTLQLVHGAGHYLQVEKPDEVAEAIRASVRVN